MRTRTVVLSVGGIALFVYFLIGTFVAILESYEDDAPNASSAILTFLLDMVAWPLVVVFGIDFYVRVT